MRIPGANVLGIALRVIGSQNYVNYYAEVLPRQRQSNGVYLSTYAAPVTLAKQSVQPVPRDRYQQIGLDFQKSYVTWYVPHLDFVSIQRNSGGDVIEWPVNVDGSLIPGVSSRYQLPSDTPWQIQDGWASAICVRLGPATGARNNG